MKKGRAGEDYILGGENVSLNEFYNTLEEVSGRKASRLKISVPLALAVARLETMKAGWLGLYPLLPPAGSEPSWKTGPFLTKKPPKNSVRAAEPAGRIASNL